MCRRGELAGRPVGRQLWDRVPMLLLLLLDYLGTAAFAVSGALKGVRKEMDVFGVTVLALVTAIGGGTVRDSLLQSRIFWLEDPTYVVLSVAVALTVFVLHRFVARTERGLLVFDAVGLGVFTAIGAVKAADADAGALGIITMAAITGVGGGVIRDVLACDIPVVLREEIYASACIAGGVLFCGLIEVGVGQGTAMCIAAGVTILLRLLSILLGWRLPRPTPAPGETDGGR